MNLKSLRKSIMRLIDCAQVEDELNCLNENME